LFFFLKMFLGSDFFVFVFCQKLTIFNKVLLDLSIFSFDLFFNVFEFYQVGVIGIHLFLESFFDLKKISFLL
jgi:hypothetical protein